MFVHSPITRIKSHKIYVLFTEQGICVTWRNLQEQRSDIGQFNQSFWKQLCVQAELTILSAQSNITC